MADKKAMLLDVSRCTACRACQVSCKQWNSLPAEKTKFTGTYQNPPALSGKTWTLIKFIEPEDGKTRWLFRKLQCLHCTDASCVLVCPVGATRRREDGVIVIDQAACTGCKSCVESCPFENARFDPETGTARKCTFCLDRIVNGLEPACAKICPSGAIVFGERDKIMELAIQRRQALAQKDPNLSPRIYGDTELSGMAVIHLLPETASRYGLPEQPRVPTAKIFFKWIAGIIPGAAVLYGLWRYFSQDKLVRNEKPESGGGE